MGDACELPHNGVEEGGGEEPSHINVVAVQDIDS